VTASPTHAIARRAVFESFGREARTEWVQATGDSMEPLIHAGSWLRVRFGEERVGVGAVVLLALGEQVVAHRVVGICRDGSQPRLVTKGDARATSDPPISLGDVLGIVEAIRRDADSPPLTSGCTGAQARLIAAVSRLAERAGIRTRRIARRLPDPLRRYGVAAGTALAGSASRGGATPAAWLATARSRRGRR